jgi:hypothetical protein
LWEISYYISIVLRRERAPNPTELHDIGANWGTLWEAKNSGDMSAGLQMLSKVFRHCGSVVSNKDIVVVLNPRQNIRVRCSKGRRAFVSNAANVHFRELFLNRPAEMFI